jgi:hypothetical protein
VSDVHGMAVNVGVPEMNVILVCPLCKTRKLYGYDEWVKSCLPMAKAHQRIRCDNPACKIQPVMVYHKDVKE